MSNRTEKLEDLKVLLEENKNKIERARGGLDSVLVELKDILPKVKSLNGAESELEKLIKRRDSHEKVCEEAYQNFMEEHEELMP